MGLLLPHVANHNQMKEHLIMTDMNIQNLSYFLKELGKNLRDLDFLIEQETLRLQNLLVLHSTMDKMCNNWLNQLEHQK